MKRILIQTSCVREWDDRWLWSVEDISDANADPVMLSEEFAPTQSEAKDAAIDWFLEHCPDADVMVYESYELASAE
jgi:hypothetical protein